MRSKKIQIGTVSHGTMRAIDLVPNFCEVLASVGGYGKITREGRKLMAKGDTPELTEFLNERLWDAMQAAAPPYAEFGAHEGDGSDYGFWPSIEALSEDAREGDTVVKVEAGNPWPEMAKSVVYVMEVTDHGNVTLRHRSNGREIWSVA
jgi:hypothetical protein